jgi:sporulation integral membrane protein YlbJ
LFPFLVLSGFIVKSGLSQSIGRRLERVTRFVFGLPGCCAPGILVSFIGGYPAGGIAVGELVERGAINRSEGRRMLCFCINGGPAFIISAVGAGMMGNIYYGVMLYAAHIAAAIILGIGLRIGAPLIRDTASRNSSNCPEPGSTNQKTVSPATAFVDAVNTASRNMLSMCGFIVLFAAALSLADGSGASLYFKRLAETILSSSYTALSPILSCLFPCFLEVSCGSVEAAGTGAVAPLLLGMALGWGGLSVHCQIAAALQGKHLITGSFFAARALHAMLGGILSLFLFRHISFSVNAFSSFNDIIVTPYSTSAAASAALLLLCALFLFTVATRKDEG